MLSDIASYEDLKKIQLTRAFIEVTCHIPYFNCYAAGCYVRIGTDHDGYKVRNRSLKFINFKFYGFKFRSQKL